MRRKDPFTQYERDDLVMCISRNRPWRITKPMLREGRKT